MNVKKTKSSKKIILKITMSMTASSSVANPVPPLESGSKVVLLPQLDRNQFKNVVHWGPEQYHLLRKNKGKKEDEDEDDSENDEPLLSSKPPKEKKESTLSCYMEDEHGKPIPESERTSAHLRARLFWNGLRTPPVSGQKVDLKV